MSTALDIDTITDDLASQLADREREKQMQDQQEFVKLCVSVASGESVSPEAFEQLGKDADAVRQTVMHVKRRMDAQQRVQSLREVAAASVKAQSEADKLTAKMRSELEKVRAKYQPKIDEHRDVIAKGQAAKRTALNIETELDQGCLDPNLDRSDLIQRLRDVEKAITRCRNGLHRPVDHYSTELDSSVTHNEYVAANRKLLAQISELKSEREQIKQALTELRPLRIGSQF